jgi:branched-chain amino acid transport system ATP-binding protein
MSLLVAENLDKRFGGVVAAKGVSFTLARGELLALIGPNGAGKSTTFNMIGGQLAPDGGRVLLEGTDVTRLSPRRKFRRGVGRTFQIAETFHSMTVAENVQMALISHHRRILSFGRAARRLYRTEALEALAGVGMAAAADRAVSTLAYGDVKRVELAVALASRPTLLLMDEPTAGMAPPERAALMRLVETLAHERQIGVLFTEHDMETVFGHADRVLVLVRGEIIADGPPDAVSAEPRVRELYLGAAGVAAAERARRPGLGP